MIKKKFQAMQHQLGINLIGFPVIRVKVERGKISFGHSQPFGMVANREDRDWDQKENFTGTEKKNYRDQRLNPRLYDGLNSVNFCTTEVTLFEKRSRKVLVVD